jgi:hypothetical protein
MVWIRRMLERDGTWPTMRWILAGSMCLSVAGIWWGLPADWVAIELTPSMVLKALSQHFSHGWADPYPPLHFYVLSVAISPMLLLEALNRVDLMDPASYAAMALMSRFISVVLALGIVLATCRCGVRLFGARAGVWAAGIFTLVAPFLYYSKTANVDVPYLFWASLSLLCYLRILESHQHAQRPRTWDYVGFAATATLSVCTKDQAYGLFALAPLVIVYEHWRANRRDRTSHPIVGAIVNGPMIAAALTAVVLFALIHNLLFNSSGFVEHVRFITGPGSVLYRAFPRTLGGHVQLLGRTIFLIQVSFGWPFFLLAIAGLLIGLFTRRLRRASLWLLVPAVSYYAAFINVILYDYDRFVLPICLVLAVFGGLAIDRALAWSATRRRWVAAAVGAAFAYTVLYASAVDVLMMGDSRYASQRWLAARVRPGDLIGHVFDPEQLPRLDGYRHTDVTTIAELQTDTPAFYVLNADYARAVPPNEPETPTRRLVEGLQGETLGYHLVYRFRRPAPWPWLPAGHPDLFGPREEFEVLSTLHNINPMIEIFQRDVPAVQ